MSAAVLLHLIEPAAWRSALDDGAVRPASLLSDGFVHLSTPEQVHLPANRLFPGRRDLVLLVVDPVRLTGPVRWEPGVPGDPGSMRFPHLYGPLPVTAVVAVVPYRPDGAGRFAAPGPLPTSLDALGRELAFQLSLHTRRAAEVEDVPGGVAVADREFPSSFDDNRLLLSTPVDAGTVAGTAQRIGRDAGWTRPAATLRWAGAEAVAQELAGRGWEADELLVMARDTGPVAAGDLAEVVAQEEVHPLWERSWRALGLGDQEVAQLVGREFRNDRAVAVSDVVVREGGRVVAAGQLRVDGATAVVDSVLTDPAARGRGHAGAVLARLLALAADAGTDLTVLEARAGDWPRRWYARRGFREVGSVWEVLGPALRPARTG